MQRKPLPPDYELGPMTLNRDGSVTLFGRARYKDTAVAPFEFQDGTISVRPRRVCLKPKSGKAQYLFFVGGSWVACDSRFWLRAQLDVLVGVVWRRRWGLAAAVMLLVGVALFVPELRRELNGREVNKDQYSTAPSHVGLTRADGNKSSSQNATNRLPIVQEKTDQRSGEFGRDELAEFVRMSGSFAVTSYVENGKHATAQELNQMKVVRTRNEWTLFRGTRKNVFFDRLNPQNAWIDITTRQDNEEITFLGIYEVEQTKLRICYACRGGRRPDAFEDDNNAGRILMEMRRFSAPEVRVTTIPNAPEPGRKFKLVVNVDDPENGTCSIELKTGWTQSAKVVPGSKAEFEFNRPEGNYTYFVRGYSHRSGLDKEIVHSVRVTPPTASVQQLRPEAELKTKSIDSMAQRSVREPPPHPFQKGSRWAGEWTQHDDGGINPRQNNNATIRLVLEITSHSGDSFEGIVRFPSYRDGNGIQRDWGARASVRGTYREGRLTMKTEPTYVPRGTVLYGGKWEGKGSNKEFTGTMRGDAGGRHMFTITLES